MKKNLAYIGLVLSDRSGNRLRICRILGCRTDLSDHGRPGDDGTFLYHGQSFRILVAHQYEMVSPDAAHGNADRLRRTDRNA